MKNLIAVLIKEEKQPKFFLIEDKLSEFNLYELLQKFKIKKETIQSIENLGEGVPDPLFLANLENKDGNLNLVENYADSILDMRVRKNRNILLEATDKQYMEAFSRGDQKMIKMVTDNKQ